jgi:hypothetical protein
MTWPMTWLLSGPSSAPVWPPVGPLIIAKPDRGQTGADGGLDRLDGLDRVSDGGAKRRARWGGGRKDYLLLKEKTTHSVYVSCKSSSASEVSDAGWLKKTFTVTNLPHCSSNVVIRHDDATQHCDSDVILRCDFALSCHNKQPWSNQLLSFMSSPLILHSFLKMSSNGFTRGGFILKILDHK